MMAWVYLDDQFPDHPKVAQAGGDAAWLFVCGLAYIKRYGTEGRIPKGQVPKLSDRKAPAKLARRLVEVGLWVEDGDSYRVHDYDQWNRPGETRKAAARKAAQARWRNGRRKASGNANAHADAVPPPYEPDASDDAEPDASGCPLPPTDVEESSSGLTPVGNAPDDDEPSDQPEHDPTTETTLAILAQRDLDRRQENPQLPPIGDLGSWLLKATEQRRARNGDEIAQLRAVDPDAGPEQLADAIDQPAPSEPEADPQQAAMLAAADGGLDHVQAIVHAPLPDPDVQARARVLIAEARRAQQQSARGERARTQGATRD